MTRPGTLVNHAAPIAVSDDPIVRTILPDASLPPLGPNESDRRASGGARLPRGDPLLRARLKDQMFSNSVFNTNGLAALHIFRQRKAFNNLCRPIPEKIAIWLVPIFLRALIARE